jgi:hypothetical protein
MPEYMPERATLGVILVNEAAEARRVVLTDTASRGWLAGGLEHVRVVGHLFEPSGVGGTGILASDLA